MLDKILNFLFRKKIGVLVVIASMCAIGFTMTGCFGWSMLSCFCNGLGCDECGSIFEECDDTFSCDTGCALLDCMFGYGCEEDCGDCTLSCGGCNSTMCTDCGDAGCGSDGCGILNFTCTKNDGGSDSYGEDGCSGCNDDIYNGHYYVGIKYYLIIGDDQSSDSKYFETDKVFGEDNPPKSYTFNVSSFYKETYYDLIYVLDENDKKIDVNGDGDFTLSTKWEKDTVQYHYIPGEYKIVLSEKRAGDDVNIYLGYVGVDKEGNYVSGIDKETELKTTVKVGETLLENAFTAPDIEGYNFKGFYYYDGNGKLENSKIAETLQGDNSRFDSYNSDRYDINSYSLYNFSGLGQVFHLSSYYINPDKETLEFTVIAVYEEIKSDVNVKIYRNGQFTELERTIASGLTHDYKLSDLKDTIERYNSDMSSRQILKTAEFIGWSTTENGTGGIRTFDELESSDIKINTDITVYLFYKTKATIVLHNYEKPNVGTEEITSDNGKDLYYGDSYTLPTTLPQNGRFTFEGWYKDSELTQPVDSNTVNISDSTIEFYANWNEKTTFKVKYYASRDYYNAKNDQYSATYNRSEDLSLHGSDMVITPSHYEFKGWFVLDESGNKLSEEPVTSLAKQTYESDLSLIAAYSIDVKLIYGSNAYDRTLYYQESCALPIPTTTDNSQEFAGWYTKRENGEKVSEKDGTVESFNVIFDTVGGNFLYATWATKTFTVNFYQYGSSMFESKTVEYGGTVTAPVADERTGYTFKGWYTAQEGGTEFDSTSGVTSNKNYYAQYTANKYTITLMVNGTEWRTVDVYYGQTATLPTPTVTGQYFAGWLYNENVFTNADGKIEAYNIAGDITLNANFA